jgi:hypothetical protein
MVVIVSVQKWIRLCCKKVDEARRKLPVSDGVPRMKDRKLMTV